MATPLDDLRRANDDYHVAVRKVFRDNDLPVDIRAMFGVRADAVFNMMVQADGIIAKYYE